MHVRSTNSLTARSTAYHLTEIRETKIVRKGRTENNRARNVSIQEQNWLQFFSKAEIDLTISRAMYFFTKAYSQFRFCKFVFLSYVHIL